MQPWLSYNLIPALHGITAMPKTTTDSKNSDVGRDRNTRKSNVVIKNHKITSI